MPSFVDIIGERIRRHSLFRFAAAILGAWAVAGPAAPSPAAEPIAVFPAVPFDAYIVYESLAVFWLAILCLIVVIRMKLKEIERTQAMGADRDGGSAPLLE